MNRNIKLAALGMITLAMVALAATSTAAKGEANTEANTEANAEANAEATGETDKAIAEVDAFIAAEKVDKTQSDWKSNLTKPPKLAFSGKSDYFWNLDTNKGDIKIKLYAIAAPMHVSSTIYLTRLGFYDDIVFHRVITGFMAQGGDPTGTGRGGPGYKYAGEFQGGRKHTKAGTLSMANAGPNTDGSQFFLTFTKTPHLNGKHTVFGGVVDGMDTVKALEMAGSRRGKPTEPLFIEKATISVE